MFGCVDISFLQAVAAIYNLESNHDVQSKNGMEAGSRLHSVFHSFGIRSFGCFSSVLFVFILMHSFALGPSAASF